jgi:hypothetical protein
MTTRFFSILLLSTALHAGVPVQFHHTSDPSEFIGTDFSRWLRFRPDRIRLGGQLEAHFLGTAAARLEPRQPTATRVNLLSGQDPTRWSRGLPGYQRLVHVGLYPGIDLVHYATVSGLKSDYVLRPGAAVESIRIRYEGARRVRLSGEGSLEIESPEGTVREGIPEVYELDEQGTKQVRFAEYRLLEGGVVGFHVPGWTGQGTLVIDPELTFSSYWGGNGNGAITAVATGSDGAVYATGWTAARDLALVTPLQNTNRGSTEAFVLKLNPGLSSVAYATYLGGNGTDRANAIAVDAQNNVYVAGHTTSINFPLSIAGYQRQLRGVQNGFISKLNAAGNGFVFSTYLGGNGQDTLAGVKVDDEFSVYFGGNTTSTNFPVQNAIQTSFQGVRDAVFGKLNAAGAALVFSSYLAGSGADAITAIDVRNRELYVTGWTESTNFVVTAAFRGRNNGGQDAFVSRFGASGTTLLYSTYLGGSNGAPGLPEMGLAIAAAPNGDAVVGGVTSSANFPIAGGGRATFGGGGGDGFVSRFVNGRTLAYSSYLGGRGLDLVQGVAVNAQGSIFVTGQTSSSNFPTFSAFQPVFRGLQDGFLAQLNTNGAFVYSSFLGGTGADNPLAIALTSNEVIVGGNTQSLDFPLVTPWQATAIPGASQPFLSRFRQGSLLPPFFNRRFPGLFRAGTWFLDRDADFVFNAATDRQVNGFGASGDLPVVGDWDNTGWQRIGFFRGGTWFLDMNRDYQFTSADRTFTFGQAGDQPFVIRWNGITRIGVFRAGQWIIDANGNFSHDAGDVILNYGQAGDIPLVGNWGNVAEARIGVFRAGFWFLDWNGNFILDDPSTFFGDGNDIPVIGDWTNSGQLRIGIYRLNGQWFVDVNNDGRWTWPEDTAFNFGAVGDRPVMANLW